MALDPAQNTTGALMKTLPEALWTAGTSLLSSLPFMGVDDLLIYSHQIVLSAHTLSEVWRGKKVRTPHGHKISEKRRWALFLYGVTQKNTESRLNFKASLS